VIDGAKRWIGNASIADVVVGARCHEDGNVKAFLVEPATPGYQATVIEGKGAARSVWQADVRLDGVRIPLENVLPGARSFKDAARASPRRAAPLRGPRTATRWPPTTAP
jgi:glutaryl-CoA dehydrogenase